MEPQDPTKVRLLEAAGEEFACKGFDAARIRTISDRARANVAAVNYHFGDKEQLYVQSVLHAHRCGAQEGNEAAAPSLLPAEQLRCFIHHFLAHVLAIDHPDDWRHRLMLREMLHPTSASDVLIREAIRPKFERLQEILRQFCPAADDRKLNALTFSVIGQCLHYRMARAFTERLIGPEAFHALDLDYLTNHITSFCLAALGCVPPIDLAGETLPDAAVATSPAEVADCVGSQSRC
jgi:TetR/AcrR family transcriptional regulator, regulator of cefoperazone and chloramphenicol sensitivity